MSTTMADIVASAQAEEAAETAAAAAPEPIVEVAAPEPAPEPTPEPEPVAEAPQAEPEPEPPPAAKPDDTRRRIAQLTRKYADADNARQEAERKLAAAQALLDAAAPAAADAPKPAAPPTTAEIEEAAAKLVAQREFDARRTTLVADGTKEFGKEAWDEKTGFLHEMGATANQAFMQTLVDLPGATKIVAQLADDPDGLAALLAKTPTAMAAAMGRMSAEVTRPAAPVRLSNAPRPQAPVQPAAVVTEPSIDDEEYWSKRPMKEWVAAMDKHETARRAGRRRA